MKEVKLTKQQQENPRALQVGVGSPGQRYQAIAKGQEMLGQDQGRVDCCSREAEQPQKDQG